MSTNDITGDKLTTGAVSDKYRDNYDLIFGNPKKVNEHGGEFNRGEKSGSEEGRGASEGIAKQSNSIS